MENTRARADWVKMVRDLRRSADQYEKGALCPSCTRNGLQILNPGCTSCSGTGKTQYAQAAESYRAKAELVMRNQGLTEADVAERKTTSAVDDLFADWVREEWNRQQRARYAQEASYSHSTYWCPRCTVSGRPACSKCSFAGHCAYCHQSTDDVAETVNDRASRETGAQNGPNRERAKRGRGPSSKSYQNDPGRYWYERAYHKTKSDAWYVDSIQYGRDREAAADAGFYARFQAGVEAGNVARAKKNAS